MEMTVLRRCAGTLAMLLASVSVVLAAAATQQDWDDCQSDAPARVIAACARIIGNGDEPATNQADALIYRGGAYVAQGDLAHAIADYGEAIRLMPDNIVARLSRALAYARQGEHARAVIDYTVASRRDAKAVADMAANNADLATIAADARAHPPAESALSPTPAAGMPFAGLTLAPLDAELRQRFRIAERVERGVAVTAVAASSDAATHGISPGDVVLQVTQVAVATPADVAARIDAARRQGHHAVLMFIANHDGTPRFVALPLAPAAQAGAGAGTGQPAPGK
jgi:hypothetical protein